MALHFEVKETVVEVDYDYMSRHPPLSWCGCVGTRSSPGNFRPGPPVNLSARFVEHAPTVS
jgi:hypothetical protein